MSAIVYSIVCSGADQRKHQSSASLAFVREIYRWPVNSPHKEPVTRKMFPFDSVVMSQNFAISIFSDGMVTTTNFGIVSLFFNNRLIFSMMLFWWPDDIVQNGWRHLKWFQGFTLVPYLDLSISRVPLHWLSLQRWVGSHLKKEYNIVTFNSLAPGRFGWNFE